MVVITKYEKKELLKVCPNAHIRRTMKTKSERHHYYCEESVKVMKALEEIRSRSLPGHIE